MRLLIELARDIVRFPLPEPQMDAQHAGRRGAIYLDNHPMPPASDLVTTHVDPEHALARHEGSARARSNWRYPSETGSTQEHSCVLRSEFLELLGGQRRIRERVRRLKAARWPNCAPGIPSYR